MKFNDYSNLAQVLVGGAVLWCMGKDEPRKRQADNY